MNLSALLDRFERSPGNHLRLALLTIVLRIVEVADDPETLLESQPFLLDHLAELSRLADGPLPAAAEWREALSAWRDGHDRLPLARLESAGLRGLEVDLLLTLGFAEEDARLAALFRTGAKRLTLGCLESLWSGAEDETAGETVRSGLARLCDSGLALLVDRETVRREWEYAVATPIWDAIAGIAQLPSGMTLTLPEDLPMAAGFVAPRADFPALETLAAMLAGPASPMLCLRGPIRNGRHTLAGCLMRLLGRPLLTIGEDLAGDESSWRTAGTLAAVAGAGLAVEMRPGAGEERILPALPLRNVPLIAIAGPSGGIRSGDRRPTVTVGVPMPEVAARAELWRRTGLDMGEAGAERLAAEFRLTSGTIVGAADSAAAQARLAGRGRIGPADVQAAIRTLHDARLETVARRIEPGDDPAFIALDDLAHEELAALAARCRHREALAVGGASGAGGARALFAGPSGTGKTLAAHWLAHGLGKDLFRIDLAASVSKYIGETEKNLDRAFSAAEELDCILLLDEGDSLMTRRTDVGSSNDRYANLETNFLLQRIEDYGGILLVTSNAPDRIDEAFARRMDVVVQFRLPDETLRYEILDRHLGVHEASDSLIQEIACRCALTGGQLRNLALHARLLALDAGVALCDEQVRAALLREYRKIDSHCPLKPRLAAAM